MTEPTAGVEHLTATQCEEIFHAALSKGDAKGVEAALILLAVRDPHRAQVLLNSVRAALIIATDPEAAAVARAGLAEGDAQ